MGFFDEFSRLNEDMKALNPILGGVAAVFAGALYLTTLLQDAAQWRLVGHTLAQLEPETLAELAEREGYRVERSPEGAGPDSGHTLVFSPIHPDAPGPACRFTVQAAPGEAPEIGIQATGDSDTDAAGNDMCATTLLSIAGMSTPESIVSVDNLSAEPVRVVFERRRGHSVHRLDFGVVPAGGSAVRNARRLGSYRVLIRSGNAQASRISEAILYADSHHCSVDAAGRWDCALAGSPGTDTDPQVVPEDADA